MSTLFLLFVAMVANAEIRSTYQLPFCTTNVEKVYKLKYPGLCKPELEPTQEIYPISVSKPFNKRVTLAAAACRNKVSIYMCTYFFFGSKSCQLVSTNYLLVSKYICTSAQKTNFTPVGPLILTENNKLETINALVPSYSWPSNKLVEVNNFELIKINLIKDITSNKLSHLSLGTLDCNYKQRTCVKNSWRIIYMEPKQYSCANVTTITNTTLKIHTTTNGQIFEARKANLITSTLTKCTIEDLQCIKKNNSVQYMCALTGHIITIPNNIKIHTVNNTQQNIPATLQNLQNNIMTVAHSGMLNAQALKRYIDTTNCESLRTSMIALIGTQKITPSYVLSHILDEEVQAVFVAGTLRRLSCTKVQAVLQDSLIYKNGHISNRPLFRAYLGNEVVLASLKQNRFLTRYISNSVYNVNKKTFAFLDSILIYINNSLIDYQPAVKEITINNIKINNTFIDIEEEEFNAEMQQSISSEEETTRQQLKNLLELTKIEYKKKGMDITKYLTNTHKINKASLSGALDNLKQTFWNKTKNILSLINHIYTIIFTVIFITLGVQSIRQVISSRETYVVNS